MKDCASVLAAFAAKNGSVLSKCNRTRRDLRTGSTVSEAWKAEMMALSLREAGSTATGAGPRRIQAKASVNTLPLPTGISTASWATSTPPAPPLRRPMSSTARSASVRLFSSS